MSRIVNLANFQQFTAINVLSDPGLIPGPVVVPSTAQIRLKWTLLNGKTAVNVMYGRYTGAFAGTVAQATAIHTGLSTGAQWTGLAALLCNLTGFAGVDIRDVNTTGNPLIASTSASAPGTGGGSSLPSEVSVCLTERTAKAGVQNRGRMYISGWATTNLAAGDVIAAASMTAINNWAATIQSTFSAQGYTLVIGQPARAQYTGSTGTVHPARVATSTPVTTITCRDNHWDSQRRRGLK